MAGGGGIFRKGNVGVYFSYKNEKDKKLNWQDQYSIPQ